MDNELIARFDKDRESIHRKLYRLDFGYETLVKIVLESLFPECKMQSFEFIDRDQDYQGVNEYTMTFELFHLKGEISYGSCGGCDSIQAINDVARAADYDNPKYADRIKERELMIRSLVLHVVQCTEKVITR